MDKQNIIDRAVELLDKIAKAETEISKHADKAQKLIQLIQDKTYVKTKATVQELENLQKELENLADDYKDELFPKGKKKKNSLVLKAGEFGYKESSSIEIPNETKTAELIENTEKELAVQKGINLTLSREIKINKKMLQKYDDDVLKIFGINRNKKEVFFYEAYSGGVA